MKIKEYFFDKHKRVLAIHYDDTTLLSIDVYKEGWSYPVDYEVREDNVRLVYHRISGEKLGAEWIEYVGLETSEGLETVNVRIFYRRRIGEEEIKKAYCWTLSNVENKSCNILS